MKCALVADLAPVLGEEEGMFFTALSSYKN